MQPFALTLADDAAAWNGPSWVLVLVVLSALLSLAASIISSFVANRSRAIDHRLEQGDAKFDQIARDHATLAVDAAMKNGEVRQAMYRDFVTREEFEKHATRMAAFEAEMIKSSAAIATKLDLLIKREGAKRDT